MPTPPKLALPVREEDAASSPVLHIPPSGGLFSPRGTSPRAVFLFCTFWLFRVPHRCFRRARPPHLCWQGACVVCVFALVCSTFFHATALVLCLFFTTLHIRRDARSGSVGSLRSQRAGDQSAVHCAMSSQRQVCPSFECCRVSVLRSQRACPYLFVCVRIGVCV